MSRLMPSLPPRPARRLFLAIILAASALVAVPGPSRADETVQPNPAALERIAVLEADPRVAAALADVTGLEGTWADTRMLALNAIPAPPFDEGPRSAAFAQMLREIGGVDVRIDELGNVIGRRAGRSGGPSVMLVAHLDTVFPAETDLTVTREGNVFKAPGIGDNARGLTVLLMLAALMQRHGLETNGDILLVGTVGEEGPGNLRGIRHLFARTGHGADRVIAIDGGAMDQVIDTAVGSYRYRVTVRGPGGHSYGNFGRANPHHANATAIARFAERAALVTASGPKTTYFVARMGGGGSVNALPAESWFEIDLRSADPERLAALDTLLRGAMVEAVAAANLARTQGGELTVEWTDLGKRPAGVNRPDEPLVLDAVATLHRMGIAARLEAASTDANLPLSLGVPSVAIGRGGRSLNAHSLDEQWVAEAPEQGPRLALLLALSHAGLAAP